MYLDKLPEGTVTHSATSPNGHVQAYWSTQPYKYNGVDAVLYILYTVESNSGKIKTIVNGSARTDKETPSYLAFTPDGSGLVFERYGSSALDFAIPNLYSHVDLSTGKFSTIVEKLGDDPVIMYFENKITFHSGNVTTTFSLDPTQIGTDSYNGYALMYAGNDIMNGTSGVEHFEGLRGNDTYLVNNSGDTVTELKGQGNDKIISTISYVLAAGHEIEALQLLAATNKAKLSLTGNEFGQSLVGNNGNNFLDGAGGADSMNGRGGNDVYFVDNVGDRIIEASNAGTDKLFSTVSYTLNSGAHVETVQLNGSTGRAPLSVVGNEFAQAVIGNNGNNIIDGKLGSDTLTGRGGNDQFVFSTKLGANNVDTIVDFAGKDRIKLSSEIFTELSAGRMDASDFVDLAGGDLTSETRIVYDSRSGALSYDADGSGSGEAVQFATLQNKASIDHTAFIIG